MASSAPYHSVSRVLRETPRRTAARRARSSRRRISRPPGRRLSEDVLTNVRGAGRVSCPEGVTRAADRLDQPRSAAQLQFVAQVLDAHVHQVRITQVIETPDLLQDLFAREHLAWM